MDSDKLIVSMEIPVIAEPLVSVPDMTFAHWLPTKEEDFIISEEEDITIKIWFDENVTNAKDISKQKNVLVHKIYIDSIIKNINPELLSYIQEMDPKTGPTSDQEEIHKEYHKLGEEVYKATLKNYNLLIKYFRDIKGQYWLEEYSINVGKMHTMFLHFKAKVKTENGEWFRWKPAMGDRIEIKMIDENRYLKEKEWEEVREFITSKKRAPLIWSLIAGAEKLYGNGHTRSAITEAITALEVSLYEFTENADAEAIFKEKLADRVDVSTLKNFVNHLGLSNSINYLLPLLFSEEQLPRELLETCQEALVVRQNVVHNGQRNVDEHKLNKYIRAIRKLCSIFEQFKKT